MYHFEFLINILSRQAFSTAKGIFFEKNQKRRFANELPLCVMRNIS